jgi:hypothetical protein
VAEHEHAAVFPYRGTEEHGVESHPHHIQGSDLPKADAAMGAPAHPHHAPQHAPLDVRVVNEDGDEFKTSITRQYTIGVVPTRLLPRHHRRTRAVILVKDTATLTVANPADPAGAQYVNNNAAGSATVINVTGVGLSGYFNGCGFTNVDTVSHNLLIYDNITNAILFQAIVPAGQTINYVAPANTLRYKTRLRAQIAEAIATTGPLLTINYNVDPTQLSAWVGADNNGSTAMNAFPLVPGTALTVNHQNDVWAFVTGSTDANLQIPVYVMSELSLPLDE